MATKGMVIYSDGGCRDYKAGWGIHGYVYKLDENIKPTNIAGYHLTDKGYIDKVFLAKYENPNRNDSKDQFDFIIPPELEGEPVVTKVELVSYITGFGSFDIPSTNNVAELVAAIKAMEHAYNTDINTMLIISDSNYVIKGNNEWMFRWIEQNWIKRDGTPVPNKEYWLKFIEVRDRLAARGVKMEFRRIDGHNGHVGNDLADRYATLGVSYSIHNEFKEEIEFDIPPSKFWDLDEDKHPFIHTSRLYFNTVEDPVKNIYCLSNVSKNANEMFGSKSSEVCYSVVEIPKPDEIVNLVIDYTRNLANGVDSLIYMRLDEIYSPMNYKFLKKYGVRSLLQKNAHGYGLHGMADLPMTDEFNPPKQAYKAVEACGYLSDIMKSFLNKDPNFKVTDITNKIYLYETTSTKKGSKTEVKINKEFTSGVTFFDVEVDSGLKEELVPIRLTFSIDIPNRNALKRLEKMNPKVYVITWRESNSAFRYSTIITTEDGSRGIFCGYYSNLRVL